MIKVSVVIPCYNHAVYLPEALMSVQEQDFREWECIVVNDGSNDNTEEVAKQWCEKDPRFRYLGKENGGVGAARNDGIAMAQGEFILPLDSDDKIHKNYLQDAMKIFDSDSETTLVYAAAKFFGAKTDCWELGEYDYKRMLVRNMIYCSGIYKKNDWERVGGYDTQLKDLEDWEFWIRLLHGEKKVYKIPEIRFFYRQSNNSKLTNGLKNVEQFNKLENEILLKHLNIYEEYFGSITHSLYQITKFKTENDRIKNSIAYKFSTKMIILTSSFLSFFKKLK